MLTAASIHTETGVIVQLFEQNRFLLYQIKIFGNQPDQMQFMRCHSAASLLATVV